MTVENGQHSTSHGEASSWDYGPIDAARLKERSLLYARAAGAGEKLQGEENLVQFSEKFCDQQCHGTSGQSAALRMC